LNKIPNELEYNCFSCGSRDHRTINCNKSHYIVEREEILSNYIKSRKYFGRRKLFPRKTTKTKTFCLKMQQQISNISKVHQDDNDDYEDLNELQSFFCNNEDVSMKGNKNYVLATENQRSFLSSVSNKDEGGCLSQKKRKDSNESIIISSREQKPNHSLIANEEAQNNEEKHLEEKVYAHKSLSPRERLFDSPMPTGGKFDFEFAEMVSIKGTLNYVEENKIGELEADSMSFSNNQKKVFVTSIEFDDNKEDVRLIKRESETNKKDK
jgi:hypothetical protein